MVPGLFGLEAEWQGLFPCQSLFIVRVVVGMVGSSRADYCQPFLMACEAGVEFSYCPTEW